jgi:uncharacterized BrkB/YihY/UPF0761 family membrane protein
MTDQQANFIVLLMLLFIIFGIITSLHTIFGPALINSFISRLRNNSGNISEIHILTMVVAVLLIGTLLYYLFRTKQTVRASRTRSE